MAIMVKKIIEDGWETTVKPLEEERPRLDVLRNFDILDTPKEERFDRITEVVMEMLDVPIVLVSLIDENRQWFKSCYGLDVQETPRDMAFCVHAIETPKEVMVISDATKDDRFRNNPLVVGEPYIRFYAGAPLVTQTGFALGTLCAISNEPRLRGLSQRETLLMRNLAEIVVDLIELRVKAIKNARSIKTVT